LKQLQGCAHLNPVLSNQETRMLKLRIALSLPIALGLALSACNQSQPIAPAGKSPESQEFPAGQPTPFEKDLLALKAEITDQDEFDVAVLDVIRRHGLRAPAPLEEPLGPLGPDSKESAPTAALGKTAAVKSSFPRRLQFNNRTALGWTVTVANGATMEAWTEIQQNDAVTDPYIIGWYQTSGIDGDTQYKLKVIGQNDDYKFSRNSRFSWTNGTGTSKKVHVLAFAHSLSTRGPITFHTKASAGAAKYSQSGTLNAYRYTQFMPPSPEFIAGCGAPNLSIIRLDRKDGLAFSTSGLVAINLATMNGANIHTHNSGRELLKEVLPAGPKYFLIGYSFPQEWNTGWFEAEQEDLYPCP
jgi:hypothetical protein